MARTDDRVTQLRRGVLELAILALLAKERSFGGAIVDSLAAHPGLAASAGTVYPLLTRLRTAGLLTTKWEESPAGPPRKYYSLTATGRRELATLTQSWRSLATAVDELLEN